MARKTRPIWTYDTETDPFLTDRIPTPFVWGLYDGANDRYYEFWELDKFLEFLESAYVQRIAPIVYAHNGGKFADYHCMRDRINSDEQIMVISGRLAKFRIGDVEFRDSLNILPVALKVFAKEKVDYAIMEADVRMLPKNREIISRYLQSDCVNLYEAITGFNKTYGSNLTQAGAAMKYWQKKFNVKAPKQSLTQFELYKPYYYGGRVQCFQEGHARADFKVVDINSAYPRAMLEHHPICVEAQIEDHLPAGDALTRCFVRLDAVAQGCFPFQPDRLERLAGDRELGTLYFPEDDKEVREYFVTGWELKTALELNKVKIIRIKEVHHFTQTISFADYIEHFYDKRLKAKAEGNTAQDIYAKLLMNSLYGKFSSDPSRYQEYLIAHPEGVPKWMADGFIENEVWGSRYLMCRPLPESKQRHYNIATAASITGFVRAFLFESLCKCEGLLYCDTDSIAARDVSKLTQSSKLGDWKLEMECDEYAIAGKKLYAFGDVKKDYSQEISKYIAEHYPDGAHHSDEEIMRDMKRLFKGPGGWYKKACKGVDLTPEEIIVAATGGEIKYRPQVPTYSIHKPGPVFIPRNVKKTFKDIRKVPS